MKVFIAGASGAVGQPLTRALRANGHEVVGMTRSSAKGARLRTLGAEVVLADAFDREAVRRAIEEARPDAVVNQLTALDSVRSLKNFDKAFALTNRLRTEGTDILLDASWSAGVHTVVSQSFGAWIYDRTGVGLASETDALDPNVPSKQRKSLAAIRHLEEATLSSGRGTGIALRYGYFYGPGNAISRNGTVSNEVRKRRLPIVGDGNGVWSFIHTDDAASATVAAIEAGVAGVFNICDDEPVRTGDWIPAFAEAIGAKPPRHVPTWLARPLAGEVGVVAMTEVRGMSNAKARATFDWRPSFPSYREGFRHGLGRASAQLRSTG